MNKETMSIKSLGIEIHAIRIDGKSMTISVFKQLQSAELIDDETGEIDARLKTHGIVHYDIGSFLSHVICSYGDVIFKCPVRLYERKKDDLIAKKDVYENRIKKIKEIRNYESCSYYIRDINTYTQRVEEINSRIPVAELFDKNIEEIKKLPQLFIAV